MASTDIIVGGSLFLHSDESPGPPSDLCWCSGGSGGWSGVGLSTVVPRMLARVEQVLSESDLPCHPFLVFWPGEQALLGALSGCPLAFPGGDVFGAKPGMSQAKESPGSHYCISPWVLRCLTDLLYSLSESPYVCLAENAQRFELFLAGRISKSTSTLSSLK